ncbi:MAG TPA: CBS domain-containing protein, partial [Vicinamibacteria bacterium]|nr:CBS domain-containing protein [Vicinamibacteria bacterium]
MKVIKVKDLMKTRVATVGPDDTLHVADGIMSLGGLRHLPVISEGVLVGIVTHRDILRAPLVFYGFGASGREVLKVLSVKEVMTREVITINANATVQEAAARLLKHKVGCLPVLERGAVVGIVTTSDLLHAVAGPHDVEAPPEDAASPS